MARSRPALVIAAGILSLVAGGLFLLCGVCGAVGTTNANVTINNRDVTAEFHAHMNRSVPAYAAFGIIDVVLRLLVAIGLIVAGIGLLRVANWGRIVALAFAAVSILHQFLIAFWQVVFIGPARTEFLDTVPGLSFSFLAKLETVRVVIFALVIVLFDLGLICALLVPSSSRAFAAADEEEERPRRRKRPRAEEDEEDEEEEAPPRRRIAPEQIDEDEEDRPRRRRPRP